MPEIDGFDGLVSKLNQVKKTSEQIEKIWKKIDGHSKSTGGKGGGGSSSSGGGMPSQADMGSAVRGGLPGQVGPGRFNESAERMRARADRVLESRPMVAMASHGLNVGARFTALQGAFEDFSIMNQMFGAGDVVRYMGQMGNAVNTFLPDVTQTMNRAAGYYNAGVYGGNRGGRASLQSATFGTLGRMNGLTSEGSDARVAQFLAGRGMTASSDANSTYQQTLRTIGNAGLYMNISNEEAAQSIEGLTSASGAANMLRNFGIYTGDISSGKEKTQGQIFEELAQRLTAGRGQATVEQTQASIRRGALGVTIDSFFQGDEQGNKMFKQYMIERAAGRKMDFAGGGAYANKDNLNPLRSQMALATSNTGVQQAAESQFISGVEGATGALQILNAAAAGVAKTFVGAASSFSQLILGARTVKGLTGAVSGTVDFASKGVNALMQDARNMDVISGGYHTAMLGLGLAGAAGLAGSAIFGGIMSGSDAGSGLTSPIGGGGPGGQMGLGSSNAVSAVSGIGGESADPGRAGNLFDMSIVAKGYSVPKGGSFGAVSSIRGGKPHKGTDYNYVNAPVRSIGDGEVIFTQTTVNQNYKTGNSAGNYIAILHTASNGDKYTSLYLHLSKVEVKVGDKVRRGQRIGVSGNTGHSTGPHLHLEIVKGKVTGPGQGTAISPTEAQKISGSTVLSDGSMTTGSDPAAKALSESAGAMATSVANQQKGQLALLGDLYSGDQARVTSALSNYASVLGLGETFAKHYKGTYISGDVATDLVSGGGGAKGPGGGSTNNNVNIVVQVPDVTSADAIKFATLVKQYLDDNTLMSNTGSI
jgi:murein DD-endopeptidase MepM/ murein hydrolase activator NlpD